MIQLVAIANEAPLVRISRALISVLLVVSKVLSTEQEANTYGYSHGTPRTPIPKEAKKTKKNDTATTPSLYSSPPAADRARAIDMTIQQMEHAAAEHIITVRRPYRSMTK